jgi:hypothetical protein
VLADIRGGALAVVVRCAKAIRLLHFVNLASVVTRFCSVGIAWRREVHSESSARPSTK